MWRAVVRGHLRRQYCPLAAAREDPMASSTNAHKKKLDKAKVLRSRVEMVVCQPKRQFVNKRWCVEQQRNNLDPTITFARHPSCLCKSNPSAASVSSSRVLGNSQTWLSQATYCQSWRQCLPLQTKLFSRPCHWTLDSC